MATPKVCLLPPFLSKVVPSPISPEKAASAMQIFIRQIENWLKRFKTAVCEDLGAAGVTVFTDLLDVPHSYVGQATKLVRVDAAETGLEFFAQTLVTAFLQLSDVPHSYAGKALNYVRVNAAANALEFFDLASTLVTAFLQLSDVPHSYSGQALKALRVNAGANAVEFFTQMLTLMSDFPASYSGQALKILRVNAGATAVEFHSEAFTDLSDVPNSYSGQALKAVRVNAGTTALEFFTQALTLLSDFPASYSGQALKILRVNAGATAVEFHSEVFTDLGDVPGSYSGQANKVVAVNNAETGLTFASQTVTDLSFVHTPRFLLAFTAGAGGTTSLIGAGSLSNLAAGGLTNPAPANTSLLTSFYRSQYKSLGSAGDSVALRTATLLVTRGSTGVQGGFKMIWTLGTSTAVAQQRAFWGLVGVTTAIGNVNPSTLTDIVGVGYDSAETVLSLIYNDGSGSATKTSLGVNYPVNNSTVYRIEIKCAANASDMTITVTNLNTNASVATVINTNLPTNTVWLAPQAWANNGTTASAVQLDVIAGYLETVL